MEAKTLILGATSASVGYALSHKDCIIAEHGMNLCTDYADCMCIRHIDTNAIENYSIPVYQMYKQACSMNLVDDNGKFHPFPLVGLCAKALLEKGVQVLSFTKPLAIVKEADGYYVSLYSLNSYIEIHCKEIIDATPGGCNVFKQAFDVKDESCTKKIAASLRKKCDVINENVAEGAKIIEGKFSDEAYLQLDLQDSDSYSDGFSKIHALWQSICTKKELCGFDYIDTSHELIYMHTDFSFKQVAHGAYRMYPDTSKDAFYNLDKGYNAKAFGEV